MSREMATAEKQDKAESKGGHKQQRGRKTGGKSAGSQAQVVKNMLTEMEKKMASSLTKATVGDYVRLVQLHKELDDEAPKEIKVTWVEPAGDEVEEMESGSEG